MFLVQELYKTLATVDVFYDTCARSVLQLVIKITLIKAREQSVRHAQFLLQELYNTMLTIDDFVYTIRNAQFIIPPMFY